MKELLKELNALSESWKEQFDTRPDIPLKWTVDESGMLWLDGNWVCPFSYVVECQPELTPVSLEIKLKDGYLTVIIIGRRGEYEVEDIERTVRYKRVKES